MLTCLFSLFYVTGEFHRFLHRGRAQSFVFQHASAFCFESAAKYSEKEMIILLLFCTVW